MQNSNLLYNDSEIPIMAFITNMTISYFLQKKQMNGMKDAWNVTSDQLNISKLLFMPTMELYEG